jgi:hypothetical protein
VKAVLGPIAIALVLLSGASAKPAPAGGVPGAALRTVTASPAGIGIGGAGARTVAQATPGAGWPGFPAPGFRASRAAALPDRGELIGYPGNVVRRMGAYTWYRAAVSEAHALDAIGSGHLRLTTPDGRSLDFRYLRHVEHDSGDWTWIGELAGRKGAQAILTIGPDAVFGTIAQGDGPPLRLTMRDGVAWLVKTDALAIAARDSAAKRPDFSLLPESMLPRPGNPSPGRGVRPGAAAGPVAAAAADTIDVLVGYTPGFVQAQGGASAATTRLQYLVDVANTVYANSGIAGRVRLVHAMQVSYTDGNSNDTALHELSGYDTNGPVTPNAAFDALRLAREAYGADVVSLVRDFRDPENGNCGIAWLLGGGLQGIDPGDGWDELAFSVVSDGVDTNESDGRTYYCPDDTFVHELGHNMGAAHDRTTAAGSDGTLDSPEDYGAYTYSFGYKTSAGQGNFYTVMAYGGAGQTGYLTFSTPDSTFCGGYACGKADADNARTLRNTMPVVAAFRATAVAEPGRAREDFDGDGESDVLWRNAVDGRNTIWLSADRSTQQGVPRIADLHWVVAATGDFDGDGEHDIFWRNPDSGDNTLWYSGTQTRHESLTAVAGASWQVVGAGDFDGDGQDDILWRNQQSGKNTIWYSGHDDRRLSIDAVTDTRWQVAGVGDFDGDGEDDIFWNHSQSAKNSVWYSGTRDRRETLKTASSNLWKVAGVGDFDGDGSDDVLWRNASSGRNTIWRGADGYSQQAVAQVGDTRWKVEGTGDYDGDGVDDVLWRNAATGGNVLWPAADRGRRDPLPTIDTAWTIVP